MNYYIQVLKKYAEFNGRARRSEYWYFVFHYIVISLVIYFVDTVESFGVRCIITSLGVLISMLDPTPISGF